MHGAGWRPRTHPEAALTIPTKQHGQEPCLFCGSPADTEEHVVPKWLQRQFGLFNQRVLLCNGTTLPYRKAVVPACTLCNRDRFARLEERIQDGSASPRDYYLWALKITFGLAVRDTTLRLDRTKPEAGPLIPSTLIEDLAAVARHAFRGVGDKAFRFAPDPFGSVIPVSLAGSDEFTLADVPSPYRALGVSLSGDRSIVVLFADRGVVGRMLKRDSKMRRGLVAATGNIPPQLEMNVKMFRMTCPPSE